MGETTDRMSKTFDYTNEAFEEYLEWKKTYINIMKLKYGDNSKNVLENRFPIDVDGEKKFVVVLQHELW